MLTDDDWNFIGLPAVVVKDVPANLRAVRQTDGIETGVQKMQTPAGAFHRDSGNHIGVRGGARLPTGLNQATHVKGHSSQRLNALRKRGKVTFARSPMPALGQTRIVIA